jgi:hypothetical protein
MRISHLAAILLSAPVCVSGAVITFDPDGGAGGNTPSLVGSFDLAPGNSLYQGFLPSPAVGNTFQMYHQSPLAALNDANGDPFVPLGLNSAFEITAVGSATMVITGTAGNSVQFQRAPVQAANSFVELWYDATPDANSLTGTGYNDGTRIYLGTPSGTANGFGGLTVAQSPAGGPSIVPFDQFGVDNYPGLNTIVAAGFASHRSDTQSSDPTFFVTPVINVELATGIDTPFDLTNPSALFAGLPGGVAPGVVPNIGTVNGLNGTDLQTQGDAGLSFEIPEPAFAGAFMLAGLFSARVRRRA